MRHTLKNVGLLALLVGVLAACADPGTSDAGGSAGAPSPTAPPTVLTISVKADQAAPPQVWTLTCQPVAGTHPKATDACAFVNKGSAALLAPVPASQSCTQIFGGPQVATVKGTWLGKPVDASLVRTNGCEIARWDRVKALVGDGNA